MQHIVHNSTCTSIRLGLKILSKERMGIIFFFSKFTWKIGNRLNRKKNQFSNFSDFYFSSYGHLSVLFLKKSPQFSMMTRKIKIEEFFYYSSRSIQNIPHHSLSLFDRGHFYGGRGGVCMFVIRTQPNFVDVFFSISPLIFWSKYILCIDKI